jgi:FtsH-binding integral membrane protein
METLILILLTILVMYGGHLWITQGHASPTTYLIQTYLYIIFSFLIIASISQIDLPIGVGSMVISSLLAIISIFIIHGWARTSIYWQHLFWIILIICLGIIVYPIIQLLPTRILYQNIVIIIGLTLVLSILAYYDENNHFAPLTQYLIMALWILIIFEVTDRIFFTGSSTRIKLYNIVGLLIFAFLLLADTQKLRQKTAQCGYQSACLNFPIESTQIFLDILNLFTNLSSARITQKI